jgi:hypothetical protein
MKKSRHSEEKIIAAVRQMEGGRKTAEVARELGVSAATRGRANGGALQLILEQLDRLACLILAGVRPPLAWAIRV